MANLHYHPDNLIYIRTNDGTYIDTPENFMLDYGSPYPALPEGFNEEFYEPNVKRYIVNHKTGEYKPRGMPFAFGDDVISKFPIIVNNKASRSVVSIPLETQRAQALAAIDGKAGAVRSRYITIAGGQEATYLMKASQSKAFKDAGYPIENIASYPLVKAEADATEDTYQHAADVILYTEGLWGEIAANIERERRKGKIRVTNATDYGQIENEKNAAIAALDLL
jgi:hypothetical protein